MKPSSILKIAVLALPLTLASCGSKKKAIELQQKKEAEAAAKEAKMTSAEKDFITKLGTVEPQTAKFLTSKVKFTVEVGNQNISLTGNLKMKRDDVIRLQLMAFGFVEAARMEFTKDYVLIMDRINKQYIMAPYMQVDFLRNSGINFYTLQALFWNELFLPNRTGVTAEDMQKYTPTVDSGDVILTYEDQKMTYSWLASEKDARIKMANILYRDRFSGNSQLNWDYQDFEMFGSKPFPTTMNISVKVSEQKQDIDQNVTTKEREVKLYMKLNYLSEETGWEEHTEVSNKYREVTVDEMLKRFMAL